MRKQTGFSLIEILIALAILAIALTAALLLTTRTGKLLLHTKERMMAEWVAKNTLANIQTGSLVLQADRPTEGTQTELNYKFFYRASVTEKHHHAEEIKIQVGLTEKASLLTLNGWYWHNSQDSTW
jgi:general secretion pathway protein I